MIEAAILPMEVGAALSLHELAYTWEDEPLTPEKTQLLELLVVRAVQTASGLQSIWSVCAQEGSVWETRFYSDRMRLVESFAHIVLEILTRTEVIVATTRAKHGEWAAPPAALQVQPNLAAVREILTRTRKILEWLNRVRPPVNEEMIRRSRESLSRGEGEAVSDIIARLKNGGPLVKE